MTPGQADGADVKRFLSDLVVRLNVAPSTQKQALNALVFFLQKSPKIELVDFSDFLTFCTRSDAGRFRWC